MSFDVNNFRSIQSRIETLVSDGLIKYKKESLIHLFLTHKFYKEQFEIQESLTDGGNDCGLDAVFINRSGENPTVHLFQSKVHESERKARNAFKISSVEKLIKFFEILNNNETDLKKVANTQLEQKILEVRDLSRRDFPEFKLWLLSNGAPSTKHQIAPLKSALKKHQVEIEEFHLNEFMEFCINAHSSRSQHVFFAREAGVVEFGPSELRSFVGYISAKQLYELIKDIRNDRKIDYSVFDMNIRGFLGLDNPVNKEIFRTAASSEKIHFSSFNNGITIVGSQCKVMRTGLDVPKIGVKRMSIVNGAQTCSAIFSAMSDFYPAFDGFEELTILFRLFETDDPELINKIALSTNNQNRINPRDLRANDEHQRRLEAELVEFNIRYLRKRGDYPTLADNEKSLDALRAGQLVMAFKHHDPARAKRDSDAIFSEYYDKIFASVAAEEIVEALSWFDLISNKKQYIQDEIRIRGMTRTDNTFITYGAFHILTLCSLMKSNTSFESKDAIIEKAIKLIADQLIQCGKPAYYTFFRDPKQVDALKLSAVQPLLL